MSFLPFGATCGASSLHSFRVGEGFTDKRGENASDIRNYVEFLIEKEGFLVNTGLASMSLIC